MRQYQTSHASRLPAGFVCCLLPAIRLAAPQLGEGVFVNMYFTKAGYRRSGDLHDCNQYDVVLQGRTRLRMLVRRGGREGNCWGALCHGRWAAAACCLGTL